VGVLEPAEEPRLALQRGAGSPRRPVGAGLLDGHVPADQLIPAEPHLAEAAPGVQAQPGVALAPGDRRVFGADRGRRGQALQGGRGGADILLRPGRRAGAVRFGGGRFVHGANRGWTAAGSESPDRTSRRPWVASTMPAPLCEPIASAVGGEARCAEGPPVLLAPRRSHAGPAAVVARVG